ncbi:hypothetical protein I2I05_16445 [Hymenobacter sp. BT683]|uniref:DUF3311 domain-containing protein n=1 Tax=Hymenobacter jeongseonensis TaxID=2791027 RepID=A0ABS0IKY0_9BACT|nr:hypothetical protein [Hymenobacter jeongseonensis]MBF9238993.1 hypothetical protein [Hymenobacter jeongseonensis]
MPTDSNSSMPNRTRPEDIEIRRGQRLLFLTVLFGVMLTYPLLAVFDHDTRIGGVPLLYLYILALWIMLVALTGYLVRKTNHKSRE